MVKGIVVIKFGIDENTRGLLEDLSYLYEILSWPVDQVLGVALVHKCVVRLQSFA